MEKRKPRKIKSTKTRTIVTLFGTIISFASLVSVTMSWFFVNQRSTLDYSGVQVTNIYDVTIGLEQDGVEISDGLVNFNNFYPGEAHARELLITITNHSDEEMLTSWFFLSPSSAQEVPFVDNDGDYGTAGYYYYFGSQIQIFDVYAVAGSNITNTAIGENEYLVETNSVGVTKGQVNGISTSINGFPRLEILNDFAIAVGQTATILITFVFVDNQTEQNVYWQAWPSVGVCQRHLGLFIE